jgi:hypothetical protein
MDDIAAASGDHRDRALRRRRVEQGALVKEDGDA